MTALVGAELARIEGVGYRYPAATEAALADISFEVGPGLTAIAGPSGGGKSTVLRLLNGLVPHFHGGTISGQVLIGGRDALRTPTATLARLVGFVFQDPEAQMVRAGVEDEVAFALENLAIPRALMQARVEEAMAAAGIAGLAGRRIDTLSGGERQRVAIASALALRPRILALDEPTSQLDPAGARLVLEACRRLAAAGTAVVISEHRVGALLNMTDRLAVMQSGRLHGPGTVAAMLPKLIDPPQLVCLGEALRWDPIPLTAADARRLAPHLDRAGANASPATGDLAWELRGATAGYETGTLLDGVGLAGTTGQVTVLMGPNGGGKTTLLRSIGGLHRLRSGTAWRRPGRVAYLPQDPGVLLHRRSVRAEVAYTISRARSAQPAGLIIDRLGLRGLADRYPGDLSSGQRQRAALAAILAGDPKLVLLDEPTRGMDGDARRALTELLRAMAADGASVVLATHDSELAAEVADRVVIVAPGAVRDAGSPDAALSGDQAFATDVGRLYPGGPVTVDAVLRRIAAAAPSMAARS
ncbi:MAG: energy-coupling factor transport system ATP-binding protein [Chloroflexota bacterium]|jgi:energy-coupling factor transport system ATP-binding protein|nr:energy-coupling factor transport system ATP-binding protein [Chloroflexota bacterium]